MYKQKFSVNSLHIFYAKIILCILCMSFVIPFKVKTFSRSVLKDRLKHFTYSTRSRKFKCNPKELKFIKLFVTYEKLSVCKFWFVWAISICWEVFRTVWIEWKFQFSSNSFSVSELICRANSSKSCKEFKMVPQHLSASVENPGFNKFEIEIISKANNFCSHFSFSSTAWNNSGKPQKKES